MLFVDERGISLSELGRRAGLDLRTFRRWYAKGLTKLGPPTLPRAKIKRLADVLEISLQQAIEEIGGQTAEQRARWIGLARAAENRTQERRTEMAEHGRRQKGRAKPQAATAGMVKASRSTRMQVVKGLIVRLVRGEPTPENLQRWAHQVAIARHLSPSAVTDYWRPYLKRRQLRVQIGRPRLEERQMLIDRRLAEGKSWEVIRAELKGSEDEFPSKASLQRAYYRARARSEAVAI